MSSIKVFPSLSSDGFISDRSVLMSKLFEMFLASDASQSNYTTAQSLKSILNSETVDDYAKRDDISKALNKLYAPYYDTVDVNVTNDVSNTNVEMFDVSIKTVYGGNDYALSQSLSNDYYTNINKFDYEVENLES